MAVSPALSNRLPDYFPEPDRFDPERYADDRREDARNPWAWISFGGGRHKCVGSAFAMMQLKAIFSILLRRFEFEFAQPSRELREQPLEDGRASKATVPGALPTAARRAAVSSRAREAGRGARAGRGCGVAPSGSVVDRDLCQGHAVCAWGRHPRSSSSGKNELVHVLDETPRKELRKKADLAARYCPNHVITIEDR